MPYLTINDDLLAELGAALSTQHRKTVPLIECFSGEPLGELPQNTVNDVDRAFDEARIAQEFWSKTRFDLRERVLLRAHDAVLREQQTLLDLLQAETGKSRGQAYEEVFAAAATLRYVALKGSALLRPRRLASPIPVLIGTEVNYHPKGVVGVITPWNYPLSLAAFDVIPALMAGNGVVQKVDNQASLAVLFLRKLLIEAGLPPALWQVAAGPGRSIGQAIVDRADYVAFTGSTATGKSIAKACSERLIGASLELGGKNALIVLPDADPQRAAKIAAYSCFSSLGQLCVSTERIYLVGDIADDFEASFVAEVEQLVLGASYGFDTDLGSLASQAQLDTLVSHIEDATGQGASILSGGYPLTELGPYFFAPTVLTNVTDAMLCFRDETFGPLVSLYRVANVGEAIAQANDSEFGLNASLLTDRPARAKRLAKRLQAGSVNINEGYRATFSSTHAPMGGFKHSGVGRRNGPDGILRYVESQTVSVARNIIPLPTTSRDFRILAPVMTVLLKILKALKMP